MQNQPKSLPLYHAPIQLDPDFSITRAGMDTYSPDTALTFLHYHDHLEVGFCYEGSGVFIVENRILPFSAGCASVIFKHEMHIAQSSAEHGSKWKFIHLEPALLLGRSFPDAAPMLQEEGSGLIVPLGDPSGLAEAVRNLIEETGRSDSASVHAVKGLALCMLARLSRQNGEGAPQGEYRMKSNIKSISPALEYILENYAHPIYVSNLASVCRMSTTSFRRTFSEAMGMPPGCYIQRLRIQLATLQLLFSTLPVLEVASSAGYESLSCFNRHFKRITGMSPREYRKTALYAAR
jgi:AraC-like DNA-binding protein